MKPIRSIAVAGILGWFGSCIPVCAADTGADGAAGQKTFQSTCAGCHQLKSYAGKSETELETAIKGIVAGTVKHPKKLSLSATDIANVATYISSNEPK
jgi:mono/diheme cytochrome c family protein